MDDPIFPVPSDPTLKPAPPAFQNSNPRGADLDRRRRRRAMISVPVRIRRRGYGAVDEVSTTVDVSRLGFLFITTSADYSRGMEVKVVFPYSEAADFLWVEQQARVVRVAALSDNRHAVAIAIGRPETPERVARPSIPVSNETARDRSRPPTECPSSEPRPLVVVLDSETTALEGVKTLLSAEGYEVIAVNNLHDGREVLKLFTPAIVIAEIEGEGFPGYTLCAHVKEVPRLQRVPVVLVTKGGNPSDYRGAHSLGAVVCMTKPFKSERLLHVTCLLAPLQKPRS